MDGASVAKNQQFIYMHICTLYVESWLKSLCRCSPELAWRSGSVMDCHVMIRGSNPGGTSLFTELHVLRKGQ